MNTVHVNGIDLAVSDTGAGPAVLLVHGFPLDHSMWQAQVDALSLHWRVIAPDLRGFGRSGATPGTVSMAQFADDLAALLDAMHLGQAGSLSYDGPVVLAGLSMGGYIAFEFFRRHRQRLRALVLCDTRAVADTPEAAVGRREAAARVEREGTQVLAEMMLPRMFAPATYQSRPAVVQRLRQMILDGNPAGLAAAARGLAERADFSEFLPRIDCPTLLIVGREDAISPVAEMAAMARAIPGSRLVEIADAGHMSPLEQPAEVVRAMEEFVLRL